MFRCLCVTLIATCAILGFVPLGYSQEPVCGAKSYLGDLAQGKCEPVIGSIISKKTDHCANGLYSITGEYRRTKTYKKKPHRGLDLAASIGTDVFAAASGDLFDVVTLRRGGLIVGIRHQDSHISRYYHLDSADFEATDIDTRIEAGSKIGEVGTSGNARASCPHLHFEIRVAGYENDDPRTYTRATVDPQAWLTTEFQGTTSSGSAEMENDQ